MNTQKRLPPATSPLFCNRTAYLLHCITF